MSFKVVYIRSLKEIEPIPYRWEDNGKCWFPTDKKQIKQFQCDPLKKPDKLNWKDYICEVKASKISTWEEANNIANKFCNQTASSTSEDDIENEPPTKRFRKKSLLYREDYDCTPYTVKQVQVPRQVLTTPASPPRQPNSCQVVEAQIHHNNTTSSSRELDIGDTTLTNNLDESMSILASTSDVKDIVAASVAEYKSEVQELKNDIKSYLDEKFGHISLEIENMLKVIRKKEFDGPLIETPEINIFPLTSVEDIQAFEENLASDAFMKKVVSSLRKIIGSGHTWRQASYRLSGVLFTKEVLTNFSWTGVSRTSKGKIPFQKLHNLLGVFYQVIKFSDGSFNYSHREIFFRDGILKHAHTRLNPKKKIKENETEKSQQEPELIDPNGDPNVIELEEELIEMNDFLALEHVQIISDVELPSAQAQGEASCSGQEISSLKLNRNQN